MTDRSARASPAQVRSLRTLVVVEPGLREAADAWLLITSTESKGDVRNATFALSSRRQSYIRSMVSLLPALSSTLVVVPLSVPLIPLHGAVPLTLALATAPVAVVRA